MSRRASVALAGYFPTPAHLVRRIAALVGVAWHDYSPHNHRLLAVVDPCAGDGAAVIEAITECWADEGAKLQRTRFYGCELEKARARALADRAAVALERHGARTFVAHADALRLDAPSASAGYAGASILWGNPPYDVDSVHGRLEERFLRVWAPRVKAGGALVWIVPAASLSASADTIGRHFRDLACFRFPAEDYAAFKQVVLVGTAREGTRDNHRPVDTLVALQVRLWAADPASIPVLPERPRQVVTVETINSAGFARWERAPLDLGAMVGAHAAWSETARSGRAVEIAGVLPPAAANLLRSEFPVAVPPRPSHIAAALAAGVYSGAEVAPDDAGPDGASASGLPTALIKATFDREYVPIEEKRNQKGAVMAVIETQAPRLRITALDLRTLSYHELKAGVQATGANSLEGFTAGDLLARYGRSLLGVLRDRCPVLHDPQRAGDVIPLPPMRRTLYNAQAHAAMACLKILALQDGTRPLLLGEIGVGKSSVALQVVVAHGARSAVILCPPHLLDGWRKQIDATWGEVVPHRAFVLDSLQDVDTYAAWRRSPDAAGRIGVCILSREKAKLGHAWQSVLTPACPACGAPLGKEKSEGERARRRLTCTAKRRAPLNPEARIAEELAVALATALPEDTDVQSTIPQRLRALIERVWGPRKEAAGKDPEARAAIERHAARALAAAAGRPAVVACARALFALLQTKGYHAFAAVEARRTVHDALIALLLGAGGDEAALAVVEPFAAEPWPVGDGSDREAARADHAHAWTLAKGLLLLVRAPALAARVEAINATLDAAAAASRAHYTADARAFWPRKRESLKGTIKGTIEEGFFRSDPWFYLRRTDGGGVRLHRNQESARQDVALGDPKGLLQCLTEINRVARWEGDGEDAPACGAPLFQADPGLKRVPLASYITRRHPGLFDFCIADEAHELSSEESAQGRAATRLLGKVRDALHLTGSSSNGYASSLFTTLWNGSPRFRREFRRSEGAKFVTRYGLSKRKVQHVDRDGKVVEFGSHSERVITRMTDAGEAPGVLPPLVLRHVLPVAVTLQKADLALELPPHEEIVVRVAPSSELALRHAALVDAVIAQARKDSHTSLAGKLLGAVARLPTHPDRATVECGNEREEEGETGGERRSGGNVEPGSYVVRYPPTAGYVAGHLVAYAKPLPDAELLPKEAELVAQVRRELAEGRRVMVLGYHEPVLPRLQRILAEALGEPVAFLHAGKVAPAKREAWIDREVIGRRARVLVVNPVAVATGLNNLVWFHTGVWVEGPNRNPVVYDQASGRIDRIGKTLPTRSIFLVYDLPTQIAAHRLLMHKAGVLRGVDGLDAESALAAAGAGSDLAFAGMSLGRELYAMLTAG